MIEYKVGKRYATAIYDIAEERKSIKKIYETLNSIMETYLNNKKFKTLMDHPLISNENKKEFIKKIFSKLSIIEKHFLEYLIDKDRFSQIRSIVTEYLKIYYLKNKIVNVEGTFALKPTKKQKDSLIETLEKKTGKQINLTIKIDDSIIAGGILKIEDEIIDGSIKRQLETLWKNKS